MKKSVIALTCAPAICTSKGLLEGSVLLVHTIYHYITSINFCPTKFLAL